MAVQRSLRSSNVIHMMPRRVAALGAGRTAQSGKFCAQGDLRPSPHRRGNAKRGRSAPFRTVSLVPADAGIATSRMLPTTLSRSGSAGDVPGESAALPTLQGDLRARRRREVVGGSLDLPRTGRAAERRAVTVVRDQVERLHWVIRSRTRLAHWPSRMFSNARYAWRRAALTNSNHQRA